MDFHVGQGAEVLLVHVLDVPLLVRQIDVQDVDLVQVWFAGSFQCTSFGLIFHIFQLSLLFFNIK
jgi:hypothetical protein